MAGAAYRRVSPRPLLTAGDMSGDVVGDWIDVAGVNEITIHYKWSGTSPVGVMTVEADLSAPPHNVADVYQIFPSPTPNILVDSGSESIVLNGPLQRFRVSYIATSGTGTINAKWQAHQK